VTLAAWGAVLGGLLGAGLVLVASRVVALRRTPLAVRVLPYVRDLPQLERAGGRISDSTPAAVGVFGPVLVSAAGLAGVRAEPLRESAHRALIAVHVRAGNLGEAVRQYERCRTLIRRELGIEPSRELAELIATSRPTRTGKTGALISLGAVGRDGPEVPMSARCDTAREPRATGDVGATGRWR